MRFGQGGGFGGLLGRAQGVFGVLARGDVLHDAAELLAAVVHEGDEHDLGVEGLAIQAGVAPLQRFGLARLADAVERQLDFGGDGARR